MGQGGIVRGVGTTAAGRQTGLNSKHRKQEEGLYSRAAGDGWSMDGRLLGGNGHWGRQGVDSDYTDPTGLLLPADQVAQHPLGGGGRGDEDPSYVMLSKVVPCPFPSCYNSSVKFNDFF